MYPQQWKTIQCSHLFHIEILPSSQHGICGKEDEGMSPYSLQVIEATHAEGMGHVIHVWFPHLAVLSHNLQQEVFLVHSKFLPSVISMDR